MSIITFKPNAFASVSASKTQVSNAKALFGAKGEAIVKRLEELNKIKELDTAAKLSPILDLLKSDQTSVAKFASSAAGKNTVTAVRALVTAKTLVATINALRKIKVSKTLTNASAPSGMPERAKKIGAGVKAPKGAGPSATGPKTYEELLKKVDPTGDWSPAYLNKIAGIRGKDQGVAGAFALQNDYGVMYEPNSIAGARVIYIIADTDDLRSKSLRGKGAFTVAAVSLKNDYSMLDEATKKSVTQLGTFNTFSDAWHAFQGAYSGATPVATPVTAMNDTTKVSYKVLLTKLDTAQSVDESSSRADAVRLLAMFGLKPRSSKVLAFTASYGGDESAIVVQDMGRKMGLLAGPSSGFVDNLRDLKGKGAYTIVSWTRDGGEMPTDLPMSKFKQYGKITTESQFTTALADVLKQYSK